MEDYKIVGLYWQRDEEAIKQTANKYGNYFTIGAFYLLDNVEIILGMALCEFRGVEDYFIKHTSRDAIKKICRNIDFNEEVTSYLKCQSYNCVYIIFTLSFPCQ